MNPPGLALRTDTPRHSGGLLLCSLGGGTVGEGGGEGGDGVVVPGLGLRSRAGVCQGSSPSLAALSGLWMCIEAQEARLKAIYLLKFYSHLEKKKITYLFNFFGCGGSLLLPAGFL